MRHGTYAGSTAHYRLGEKPCDLCRGARNEYARLLRAHGPLFKYETTGARIEDYVFLEQPVSLRRIMEDVDGNPETIRRTVYRLIDRGEIVCDTYTRLYSVSSGER